MSTLAWIAYAVGYCVWLGYAVYRFEADPTDPGGWVFQLIMAAAWPVAASAHVSYRLSRWAGARRA